MMRPGPQDEAFNRAVERAITAVLAVFRPDPEITALILGRMQALNERLERRPPDDRSPEGIGLPPDEVLEVFDDLVSLVGSTVHLARERLRALETARAALFQERRALLSPQREEHAWIGKKQT